MLRVRYRVDDGVPLVVKRECVPALGISGAKLKQLVGSDYLCGPASSFDFSVDSPDGSRRTLRDTDAFALHESVDTLLVLHLRSRLPVEGSGTAPNSPADTGSPKPGEPVRTLKLDSPDDGASAAGSPIYEVERAEAAAELAMVAAALGVADQVPPSTTSPKEDCGLCVACLDKPRFGGPGIKRKGCLRKKEAAEAQEGGDAVAARISPGAVGKAPATTVALPRHAAEADGRARTPAERRAAPIEAAKPLRRAVAPPLAAAATRSTGAAPMDQVTRAKSKRAEEASRGGATSKRARALGPTAESPDDEEKDDDDDDEEEEDDDDEEEEEASPPGTPAQAAWRTDVVEPGALVWAKMQSFPWWPAQLRRVAADGAGGHARVRFCGTRQVGFVELSHVLPFASRPAWCDGKSLKVKRSMLARFRAAVGEARAAAAGQLVWAESEESSEDEEAGSPMGVEEEAEGEEEGEGEGEDEDEENSDDPGDSEDGEEVGPAPGTVVWAKLPCFPWWPATVQPASRTVPRPCHDAVFVRFFGAESYAWVEMGDHLTDFIAGEPACVLTQVKKALRGKWKRAVEDANIVVGQPLADLDAAD